MNCTTVYTMQRDCYICRREMESYQPFDARFAPETAVTAAGCPHAFHYSCIHAWIMNRPCCPLCTADFTEYIGYEFIQGIPYVPDDMFACVVRNHVWKLASRIMAPQQFTDDEFVSEIRSRIQQREPQYFHVGGSAFVMEAGALNIHMVVEYIRAYQCDPCQNPSYTFGPGTVTIIPRQGGTI